jgi:hypothetical protein
MERAKVLGRSLVNFLASSRKRTMALLFWRYGAVRSAKTGISLVTSGS